VIVIADAPVGSRCGGVSLVAKKRASGTGAAKSRVRSSPDRCPASGLLPPTAAVIPEDQEIPLGGISFHRPREEIFQDLGISGVRLAEGLQAIPFIPAALRDQKAPGLLVLQAVKLNQDIDVLCGTCPGHLLDIPEGRTIEVVVPGHIDHDRPFGLAAALNLCLVRHRAPFHPVVSGLNFGLMVKAVVWKNQRRWALIDAIDRETMFYGLFSGRDRQFDLLMRGDKNND